jgi:hypothetical protein
MSRTPKLNSVRNEFVRIISSAVNIFLAVFQYTEKDRIYAGIQGEEPLHPAQVKRIIAFSFTQVISAWEQFIQDSFMRYMIGASSPSGYKPQLRIGPCKSYIHAWQVLTGKIGFDPDRDFIGWTSWQIITDRAKIYFEEGHPFTLLGQPDTQRIADAVALRNRVVHGSSRCIEKFKKVAKEHLRLSVEDKLNPGYGVGDLLIHEPLIFPKNPEITPETPEFNNYFISYANLFLEAAYKIAP